MKVLLMGAEFSFTQTDKRGGANSVFFLPQSGTYLHRDSKHTTAP